MDELKKQLVKPSKAYQCDVRWWLAEALHTDATLKKEICSLAKDGFGSAEFLAIDELGADSSRYGWGSEEFVHDTETIIDAVTENNMGASMTSGANWSNANLPDTVHKPDNPSASKELDYTVETLQPGESRSGALQKPALIKKNINVQDLMAVVAMKTAGEANGRILLASPKILTNKVIDGELSWVAPTDGEYMLFAFWIHGTGQTANPSASVSYTINYLDKFGIDKLKEYWDAVVLTSDLRKTIKENGRVQIYMDSLELSAYGKGGQLWGLGLLDEFRSRRGYDLTPYLPFILRRVQIMIMGPIDYYYDMSDALTIRKIRNDFYQTLTDLYIDNMLKPMQKWLHSNNMTLRAEISYGLPFEISQPGKYVDGIETESLEFASQIDSYRGMAGVAHLYNKVFSSETGATMMNYMHGLNFYDQIIFTQFAAGVTKTVLHGYSSICGSDADTDWPGHEGMWPIWSERFGERQPAYRFYKDWTAMISRFQYLLRSGKPRRDVAVLRSDYNYWSQVMALGWMTGKNEQDLYENVLMRANEGIYLKDTSLQNAGYSYDYFAPQLLEDSDVHFGENQIQPDGPGYRALVLYQDELPLASAKVLLDYARQGLPIVFVNGLTETVQTMTDKYHEKAAVYTPHMDGKDNELASVISELKGLSNVREIEEAADLVQTLRELGIEPRAGFTEPNKKLFTLMREDSKLRFLYVYHYMYTENEPFSATIKVEGEGKPYALDCQTGTITAIGKFEIKNGYTLIPVKLQPGEATMFVLDTKSSPGLHCTDADGGCITTVDGRLAFSTDKSGHYTIKLSDGSTRSLDIVCREEIPLPTWELTVESWTKGEKKEITEDRCLGYVSKEVYYETAKELIFVGKTSLKPWKDISNVGPAVSGLGFYEAKITLPQNWDNSDGAVLELESTSGNLAAIYINKQKVSAYNYHHRAVEITEFVQVGENTLHIEIASTLSNRLREIGYYDESGRKSDILMQVSLGIDDAELEANGGSGYMSSMNITPPVKDYGMLGDVRIKLYKKMML